MTVFANAPTNTRFLALLDFWSIPAPPLMMAYIIRTVLVIAVHAMEESFGVGGGGGGGGSK